MTDDNLRMKPPVLLDPDEGEELFAEAFGHVDTSRLGGEQRSFLMAVMNLSGFLCSCLQKEPEFTLSAYETGFAETFETLVAKTLALGIEETAEPDFMRRLRQAKRKCALLCALADLSGAWHNGEVTRALSRFARAALNASLDFILLQNHHREKLRLANPAAPQKNSGLLVLGMGKFGADELNYSSDIDIIIFHEERPGMAFLTDDPYTLCERMAKQLVKLMQERTGDGYVFRTDLRLRPDPSSTPLVIPVIAALNYYEGQGQNWERAAMIKAAPVAGDFEAGEAFLAELVPFVWRKYLDFAAIQDVHSIKRQIHAHKGHGEIKVRGHNIKLGRGGIREVEFFAQTQQLIAGGRNPALRVRKTSAALEQLARHDWIKPETAEELDAAYWFLRNLEHRLQMIDDAQTHTLPDDKKDFARFAALCGYKNPDSFARRIEKVLRCVENRYAELFESAPELSSVGGNLVFTGNEPDPGTVETLSRLGFDRPEEVIKIVKNWHVAKIPALQASAARELLTELVPELLEAFSHAGEPDAVLYTFDRFISGLPAGIQLFAILKSNPNLNALLVRILTAAPSLAEQISRKPHVFDSMLEPQYGSLVPSREELERALRAALDRAPTYEMKLDAARRFFQEVRFQISCRYFATGIGYREAAMAYANLADAIIAAMLDCVVAEFAEKHGRVPGARTCILAMGRLGSRELTAGSDLDLIFLYDFDENVAESDGERPLDPTLYHIRLIKRFIAAMSAPTSEGALYELDFRLRPSGNAGPLATNIDGFLKYQHEEAWIWEAQALSRARPVAGDRQLCDRIEHELPQILARRANDSGLEAEICKMRKLIEKEKGTGNTWDMKTCQGGLLDIEFIAQWLVLRHGAGKPVPTATYDILATLGNRHLTPGDAAFLGSAYDTGSTVLHFQRTCLPGGLAVEEYPQGFESVICEALDLPDLKTCEAHLKELQKTTRACFERLICKGANNAEPK